MAYLCRVVLIEAERAQRRTVGEPGIAPARMRTRARVLLKADHRERGPGLGGRRHRWRARPPPGHGAARPLPVRAGRASRDARTHTTQAHLRALARRGAAALIALTCGAPPDGQTRWRLRLLADELVRLEVVRDDRLRNRTADAQKNERKPWLNARWRLARTADPDFVWRLEDVLGVQARSGRRCPRLPAAPPATIPDPSSAAWPISLWSGSRRGAGATFAGAFSAPPRLDRLRTASG
jgi:hypothetical protein